MTDTARRPGRPRLPEDEKPAKVHVRLPPDDYDRADREAKRQGVSIPELIRRNFPKTLPDGDGADE